MAETRSRLDSLRLWIAQNESADVTEATVNLVKLQQELFGLKRQYDKAEQDHSNLKAELQRMEGEIKRLQGEVDKTDVAEIQKRLDEMKVIQEKLQANRLALKEQESVLQTQEKSVRKLTLVPCGDQFPTCHYIKDSHEDKQKIDGQRRQVATIVEYLETLTRELKANEEFKAEYQMSWYVKNQQSIKLLTQDRTEKLTRLSMLEKSRKDLAQRLEQARKREADLTALVAEQDTETLEAKRKELKEVQALAFAEERKKSDLLILIGRDKAVLEQIQKDRIECEKLLARLRVLESVQAGFHKNGIPAIVLKTQLPAINAELAKLLGGLVDFNITFETEAGSNVMDIYIEDGHSRRILELGSGMEKMIASIAIRVALINLSSLPKSDILVIDEGFNALDEEHVGKCLELLQTLKGYFKSVLVISHMQRVKEAADTIVEVVSTGLDSRIEA
jgi:DNA repair exonuclease SbcCD ATPase subunit